MNRGSCRRISALCRPLLPTQRVAAFHDRVPRVHGRGKPGIAERRVALHIEVGRAPCGRPAETDARNPSSPTMSFMSLFSVKWDMASRDIASEAVFTRFGERRGVQIADPFCARLS